MWNKFYNWFMSFFRKKSKGKYVKDGFVYKGYLKEGK